MNQDAKNPSTAESGEMTGPQNDQEYDGEKLAWSAPEYVHHEKSANWYWILGIVVVAIIVIALILNNLLFAIFALIAGFAVALFSARKPEIFEYQVNENGIQVENKLYPYPTLEFFWIDDTLPDTLLIIESRKTAVPQIVIPVENIRTSELRDFLLDYLPEEYVERPWSQLLMERIGF